MGINSFFLVCIQIGIGEDTLEYLPRRYLLTPREKNNKHYGRVVVLDGVVGGLTP